LLLHVAVHPADIADRDGARQVLEGITVRYPRLRHLWLDAGYQGRTVTWIEQTLGLSATVVRKPRRWVRCPADEEPPPMPTGFQLLPRRWVVERTFAWLGRYRRLSKDYEAIPATEEAWIYLAMSSLMLARLAT
jgi:putative transposase